MAPHKKLMVEQPTGLETATALNPPARPEAEAEIADAIDRVFRHYGQNLSAFFDHVRQEGAHTSEQYPLFHTVAKHS